MFPSFSLLWQALWKPEFGLSWSTGGDRALRRVWCKSIGASRTLDTNKVCEQTYYAFIEWILEGWSINQEIAGCRGGWIPVTVYFGLQMRKLARNQFGLVFCAQAMAILRVNWHAMAIHGATVSEESPGSSCLIALLRTLWVRNAGKAQCWNPTNSVAQAQRVMWHVSSPFPGIWLAIELTSKEARPEHLSSPCCFIWWLAVSKWSIAHICNYHIIPSRTIGELIVRSRYW